MFSGFYASAHQSYRFAAADTASEGFRPKAISWVLIGGVFAGVVGAQLVIATQNFWPPYLFAATYIGQSALALIAGGVLMFVNIPKPPPRSAVGDGRPLSEIAREPRFIVAVACGVAAYSMMNMVMTSAPLAMVMCNHSITDATLGLQWHVLGMYAPSFITGSLISRFGLERITGLGFALILVAAGIGAPASDHWFSTGFQPAVSAGMPTTRSPPATGVASPSSSFGMLPGGRSACALSDAGPHAPATRAIDAARPMAASADRDRARRPVVVDVGLGFVVMVGSPWSAPPLPPSRSTEVTYVSEDTK